jgi:hypothetical protein
MVIFILKNPVYNYIKRPQLLKSFTTTVLFDGDPTCRFCGKETKTVQHITCCCEALAHQRYNVFGNLFLEPKEISTASVRDLCLYIKGTGLLNLG